MKKIILFTITSFIILFSIFLISYATIEERILERIQERNQINLEEYNKNRSELKNLMEKNQIELQNQIQKTREELKNQILEYQSDLKEKLKIIKDETKKKIIEKVYGRINPLNEIITNHYLDVLNRLENLLERVKSKTAESKINGLDTKKVEEKINKAEGAIKKAREATIVQSQRVYKPPEITSEENLRLKVREIRKQIHGDLKNVEELVRQARDAVREAARELAQTLNYR